MSELSDRGKKPDSTTDRTGENAVSAPGFDHTRAAAPASTEDALSDRPQVAVQEQQVPEPEALQAETPRLEIPSTWDGAEGEEPDCGKPIDEIKSDAVALRPKDGLQPGEYAGGFPYENEPRNERDQKLPGRTPDGQPISYQEYDRYAYDGIDRGTARFVVGSDGTHYSTDDHYRTYTRFR